MADRVVLVEFSNGKPFSVVTADEDGGYTHYDFCWCEREKCLLFRDSGNMLYLEHKGSDYWCAEDVAGKVRDGGKRKPTGRRLASMPPEWPLEKLFDGVEAEAHYCSVCDDMLPESDYGPICDHIDWCQECGWWTGEGYEDGPCKCACQKED